VHGRRTTSGPGRVRGMVELVERTTGIVPLQCVLTAQAASARLARIWLRTHFGARVREGVLGDLELVVTELVANAVDASAPAEPVLLSIERCGTDLLVEVADRSGAVPEVRSSGGLAEDGRGLVLVAALSRAWGWCPCEPGKAVWALLPLQSSSDDGYGQP
jgi:hypothetical protein